MLIKLLYRIVIQLILYNDMLFQIKYQISLKLKLMHNNNNTK